MTMGVDSRARLAPGRGQSSRGQMIERGGIRWNVQVAGTGPSMLLVHGTGASSHSFRELMPLLATRFTVVAPDLPGHGFSGAPPLFEPSLPGTSAALAELLQAMNLTPRVAVGHSAGAALIAQMSLDGFLAADLLVGLGAALVPFRGLARALLPGTAKLLSFASRLVDLRLSSASIVAQVLKSTGSSLDDGGIELYRQLSERPAHVAAALAMMAGWDLEPLFAALPEIQVPFLLLAGELDRAIPLAQQREVAAVLPSARVVVVHAAGHLLHEEQPAKVASLLLGEIDARSRAQAD